MKARVYNKIRTFLYKKQLDKITDKEKIEFFDEIYKENIITHWELINYKRKRQDKKVLYEERVKRGYNFKKKKTKQEWEFEQELIKNRPLLEEILKEDFKIEVINPK